MARSGDVKRKAMSEGQGQPDPPVPRAYARAIWKRVHAILREGVHPREAIERIAEEQAVSRRTAQRYVAAALLVLQRDDIDEPPETARALILARYEHVWDLAQKRTKSAKQAVYDEQGKCVGLEDVERPDPNTGDMMKAVGAIAIVKGVVPMSAREPSTGRFPERSTPEPTSPATPPALPKVIDA
jgi:hypothetical protein